MKISLRALACILLWTSCFCLFSTAGLAAKTGDASPRETLSFDRGWRFHRGEAEGAALAEFDDSSWRELDVPHDWSIEVPAKIDPARQKDWEGPFNRQSLAGAGGAYLDGGVGWYRKTFTMPDSARKKATTLLFDGAFQNAEVTINGHILGRHAYGYTSFFYDLTPFLKYGSRKNVLTVRLDVRQPCSRWGSGAGIYRHVWLVTTPLVHVAMWGTAVTTPQASASGAEVRVKTQVQNDNGFPKTARLVTRLLDPSGKEVARQQSTEEVPAGGETVFQRVFKLPAAQLWSLETPALYQAVNEVWVDEKLSDLHHTPFGIRTIQFTKENGFFLNGQRVQIKGVCNHHDLGCLGAAVHTRAMERQLEIMKSMGCNALRTSHNPAAPELLDLCDKMGILVMEEAFDEWRLPKVAYGYNSMFDDWAERDIASMVRRDRNHPSIIAWSTGNEICEGGGSQANNPMGGAISNWLARVCREEDSSRPVTSCCINADVAVSNGYAQALDVFGANVDRSRWFSFKPPKSGYQIGDKEYIGQAPTIASETAHVFDARGEYNLKIDAGGNVVCGGNINSRAPASQYVLAGTDKYSAETALTFMEEAPWIAGEFIWTGFDYLGEPMPFKWPARNATFGVVDMCGFPKDRYYLYKAAWSSEPTVHILPMSWTWPGFEGKKIPVQIFTNADNVELFLNGKSLGTKKYPDDCPIRTVRPYHKHSEIVVDMRTRHLAWEVPYEKGALKAVATKGGKVVAADEIRTAGAPRRIRLTPDRARIAGEDGRDLSFITAAVVDQDGTICPDAENLLHFSVEGNNAFLAGVDNGDPINHEPLQGDRHQAFHGLALAILKAKYDAASGSARVTVSADGLESATVSVSVEETH